MKDVPQTGFDAVLADAPALVLVDFYADWCGPCKTVGPILTALDAANETDTVFIKVNADRNQALMQAFGVKSLPTVLLLKPHRDRPGAAVVGSAVGARPPQAYQHMIANAQPGPSLMDRLKARFRPPEP